MAGAGCLLAFAARGDAGTPVAFPGALGFGANATGATTLDANGNHTGGNVYHVTNLNDSGSGSFRDAVSVAGRVVVFDVGGFINLASAVSVQKNITIAGQTAPGGGIGITGAEVSFANRSNIACRFIRVYPGSASASSDDCLSFYRANNIIVDHASLGFAKWNNIDAVGDSDGASTNITVQNSIIADPIGQQFAAHTEMVGGYFSWFNNLFVNGHNRQPLAKDNTIFINNVEYNYEAGYTTHTSTPFKHDIVNNYFICGPASGSGGNTWFQIDDNQSMYYTGNLEDNNKNSVLDGFATAPYPGYQGTGTVLTAPWSPITTALLPTVLTAANAVVYDPSVAGCLPHDQIESLVISQLKTLGNGTTGTGVGAAGPGSGLYTTQTQTGLSNNGFGVIASGTPPIDSDQDGMPDDWETARGLNPANAADGKATAASGYTNLEDYLNWLALPHAFVGKNSAVDIDLSQYAAGFPATATYTLSAVTGGTATQSGQGGSLVHFVPTANSGPAIVGFTFAVSNGTYTMTTSCGVLVSANAAAKSLLWVGDSSANTWDTATANWTDENAGGAAAYGGGDRVEFDDTGSHSPAVNVASVLSPGSIEVSTDNQNYTFSGYGWLSGATALVKDGAGTLTIAPTILSVSGTMASGSATLTVPSTANMTVGMGVTANSGVPSGTSLAAINGATSVTLSKAATATQTISVNFVPTNNYSGPTTFNAGTIVLGSGGTLGTGVMNLYGTLTNNAPSGNTVGLSNSIVVGAGSTGTINMGARFALGGSVTGGGTLDLNVQTTFSRDDLTGAFAAFAGTVNFLGSGGVRLFLNGGSFDGFTASTVNLGSGVSLLPQTSSTGNTINVGELDGAGSLYGGTTAASATWVVGGLNTSSTFSGAILDNATYKAAFIKTGTGTLTLTGASNFTGPATVSGGTLATLGTFGGLLSVSGGTLSLGTPATPTGTLTAGGGLTLAGGTVAYGLSNSPTGSNDKITVSAGTLTLSGTDTLQVNMTNGVLGSGYYALIDGASTMAVSNLTLNLVTTPTLPGGSRQTLALQRAASGAANGYVGLKVTGDVAALTWTGANGGIWDLSTTQSWSSSAASNPNLFYNFDTANFDDSATNGTVTLSGTVQPNAINVTANSTNDTFTGNGAIGGSASLVKSGSGKLTISNSSANTFTGGTTLNAGTLSVSNANSGLGTGPVAVNGGTLDLQAVTLPNAFVFTGSSAITTSSGNSQIVGSTANTMTSSGSAALDLSGVKGILSINGDMSGFTGTIAFGTGSGMLRLNANSSGASDVNTGSAAATFDLGSANATLSNRNGGVTVNLGAVQSTSSTTTLQGRQSGGGGYTDTTAVAFSGGGGTGAAATATAKYGVVTGVTITNGGSGYTSAPTVTLTGGTGTGATATATVSGGVVTGVTVTSGGTGARTATNLVVGALNADAVFAGKIYNSPGTTGSGDFLGLNIYKLGTGTWTLSGASNFIGDVIVQQGKLTVSGALANDGDFEAQSGTTLSLATPGSITTSTVMIDQGAAFTGCGTINGDVVNQGTASINCSTLTVNGAIENDGMMSITNGAALVSSGVFVNNGLLDMISGSATLPAGIQNNGTVLDSTSVKVQQMAKSGTTFSVSVQTYTGHNFILQRASSLTPPVTWQNVQTQSGTGAVLSFSDTNATGSQSFYRFQISP